MSYADELVADTLAMVNVVRAAYGKPELDELPDARPGDAGDCLFYRAFSDLGVTSVTGGSLSFNNPRVASTVGTLWGVGYHDKLVTAPPQFTEVISMFDERELDHYATDSRRR